MIIITIINKHNSSNIYYIYTHHYLPNLEYFDHYFSLSWAGPRSPGWSKIGGCGHLPKHVVSLGISQNHSKSSGTRELTQLTESISCAMPILMVTTYPSLFVIGLDWN